MTVGVLRFLPVRVRQCCVLLGTGLLLGCLAGCPSSSEGPSRYSISGKVQYAGRPIVTGSILFEPDTSKGNSGPGAYADIQNGQYSIPVEKGIVGGTYVVRITGSDATGGIDSGPALINNFEIPVELPKENTRRNFNVPEQSSDES